MGDLTRVVRFIVQRAQPCDVDLATLGWVQWHNCQRLHTRLRSIPPEEFEAAYAARQPSQQPIRSQWTNPPEKLGRFK